ncbi:tellurite resistance TerB family protein [Curvivirga aplysinae]|uniref:tellurite resistance TerB family protein n=1 Tax=Curvivirga aplysinae TaxID=2529852 RepID=UPI0012BC0F2D|nr:tellurite resistance TerB family protein [Curvivirga aplysinae]MTI09405.1 tellurite resistance TerB family protein [Curvivirga aplysinae]
MDVNSILSNVMGTAGSGINKAVESTKSGGMGTGLVGGAAVGGLAALLLSNKKARKMGKKALTYGGLAAVGGLAYKAWSDHKSAQSQPQAASAQAPCPTPTSAQIAPPPAGSIFDLAEQQTTSPDTDIRLILIRAMISAAKADGHIDTEERARIEEQIAAMQIGQEEQQFLVEQLNATSDPISIARLSTGPEQAAEIFMASALAVDVDSNEERRYLDRLADALLLPEDLRQRLEAEAQNR